jgi:hypothetical protein
MLRSSMCRLFLAIALVIQLSAVQDVYAGPPPYACDDDKCTDERKAYARYWKGKACDLAKSLKRLLERKARLLQRKAQVEARLNNCLRRARNNPYITCTHLQTRLNGILTNLQKVQFFIDRKLMRLQFQCNYSVPAGFPNPVNPTCQELEAARYCPIFGERDGLAKIQKRCDALTAEVENQAFCPACKNPLVLARAANLSPQVLALAEQLPSCPAPAPQPTSTQSPAPVPQATSTATPSQPAPTQTPTSLSTLPPLASVTPQASATTNSTTVGGCQTPNARGIECRTADDPR